jgi:hypothetical protein
VTVHQLRFTGPATLAVGVATELADAPGIDLTSSAQPTVVDTNTVELMLTVDATGDAVAAAVDKLNRGLPTGASISITD